MTSKGKVKDIIKLLDKDGWVFVGKTGSHRQFKYLGKPGRVTVPGKQSASLAEGIWRSIIKQASLRQGKEMRKQVWICIEKAGREYYALVQVQLPEKVEA